MKSFFEIIDKSSNLLNYDSSELTQESVNTMNFLFF